MCKIVDLNGNIWYTESMLNEKLLKIYKESGADALFIESDFIRRYLTGYYATDGYVILDGNSCKFVVDLRYFEAAEKVLKGTCIEAVEGSYGDAIKILGAYKKVGVPYPYTDMTRAEALKKEGFELVDCMPALKEAMLYKTDEEIAKLQKACDIAEDALLKLMPQLKEGMTEREAAAILEFEMRKLGADGPSFDTILCFGAGSSVPHHETGETKLKFGDVVLVDFGCKVEGYCSDCTRTFLFGDDGKHEEFKKAYAEVLKAHELVKEKLVAGMTGKEADEIARASLREAGFDKYFTHSLGHGIGLLIHEFPRLSVASNEVIKDGMVYSDEPGVYLAGKYGIRIEDSCYMKDGKTHSFMKKTNRNLIIL